MRVRPLCHLSGRFPYDRGRKVSWKREGRKRGIIWDIHSLFRTAHMAKGNNAQKKNVKKPKKDKKK